MECVDGYLYPSCLDDKIICHDLISAELQAKTLKGWNTFWN